MLKDDYLLSPARMGAYMSYVSLPWFLLKYYFEGLLNHFGVYLLMLNRYLVIEENPT
jgi:hypothetical protein